MDRNQSTNPLAWGSLDGPKSVDHNSWAAKQAERSRMTRIYDPNRIWLVDETTGGGYEIFDPENIPETERHRIITFCRFLIYTQKYKAEVASKIVDHYLHFLEAHPEFEKE